MTQTMDFDVANARDYDPTDFEIDASQVIARPKRTPKDIETEKRVCEQLRLVGNALTCKFDLSQKTARIISKGTKGFVAHRFTSVAGGPKVAGTQLSGALKLDRYLSYRLRDDIFALCAIATWEDPQGFVRFQVLGPKSSMKNVWTPFETLRSGIQKAPNSRLKVGGCSHEDIFSAWRHLDDIFSNSAVRRFSSPNLL